VLENKLAGFQVCRPILFLFFSPTPLDVPLSSVTHPLRDARVPSFQSLAMTATTTTSAGTPASQPTHQAPSVSTTITPQKTPQTTFFSSVFNPQISTYFIAGGVAGAASRTVVSPLERIKIIQSVFLLGCCLGTRSLMHHPYHPSSVSKDRCNLLLEARNSTGASGVAW